MATGTAVIDFGSYPGSNEASVVVTGQSSILATTHVEAWMMAEASSDHTVNDASYAALLTSLSCGIPTAATGFTIYARSTEKLQGTFKVRWVWAD
jgi:hypothetical protein